MVSISKNPTVQVFRDGITVDNQVLWREEIRKVEYVDENHGTYWLFKAVGRKDVKVQTDGLYIAPGGLTAILKEYLPAEKLDL